jgi:hypothetical protein
VLFCTRLKKREATLTTKRNGVAYKSSPKLPRHPAI